MKPSTRRVLHRLIVAGGGFVRGNDLAAVGGFRFGGRIHELRHDFGYLIERAHDPFSAVDRYRLVSGPQTAATDPERGYAPDEAPAASDLAYTNTRACSCGEPIPEPPPGTRGRRAQFCDRCKQTRRALSYIRAGERILEQVREPERVA